MVFSPADVMMPTTSPFSFTTGDPTELAAVAPAISNRSDECAVMVASRALPSFPASELPITATFAPCRELAGFGQVKKPQKLLGLHVGLEHRQIRRLRNGENSVHIVNSAVRRLRDSVNAAFNCMCSGNKSAVCRNKKTALGPQQIPFRIERGHPNHRRSDLGFDICQFGRWSLTGSRLRRLTHWRSRR